MLSLLLSHNKMVICNDNNYKCIKYRSILKKKRICHSGLLLWNRTNIDYFLIYASRNINDENKSTNCVAKKEAVGEVYGQKCR